MIPHIFNLKYRHNNMEFGKDFTFSYFNPLNQRVNVGFQAKWGDIRGSSTSLIREIVDQIKVAFKVPYKNKPDDKQLYLNELYIVCSGEFKNNAIEIIDKARARVSLKFLSKNIRLMANISKVVPKVMRVLMMRHLFG